MEEINNVCADCGYEGPEDICPECGGEMVPAGDTEEGLEGGEDLEEEDI